MTEFIAGGIVAVVIFCVLISVLRAFIRVCPPNMVLVVTGTQTDVLGKSYGFRLQKGGYTFVIPYFQSVQMLDLSIIPINVRVDGVNAANGITVGADATACVCIDDQDEALLYSAVERLMGKTRPEIQEQIQQTMIGNFRGALNKTTPLEAIGMVDSVEDEVEAKEEEGEPEPEAPEVEGERAQFRQELLRDSNQDLSTFGMAVVSVSLQKIWDTSSYIANLANKSLSRKRRDVEVQEARLKARAERAESDAARREQIAQNQANEKIVEAQKELEVARRQCQAEIEQTRLEADGAIAKAKSEGERSVQGALVDLQELKNVSEVTLEAGAEQRSAEINAEGESEAIRIFQEAKNDLLRQKATLLAESGDSGKIALFVQQHLSNLFEAYLKHAENVALDNLVVMDEENGINRVINRGPEGLVDFLKHFEEGFGIRIRDFLQASSDSGAEAEVTS